MIVAVKRNGKIVVGISVGYNQSIMTGQELALEENIPIWKAKGSKNCHVFVEEATRSSDILRYSDNIFQGITDADSVIKKVVPKMQEALEEYSLFADRSKWESRMLILKDDKLLCVSPFFVVREEDEFVALGEDGYALGVLEATRDKTLEQSILAVFETVKRETNKEVFPVVLFDGKTKRRKVVYHA